MIISTNCIKNRAPLPASPAPPSLPPVPKRERYLMQVEVSSGEAPPALLKMEGAVAPAGTTAEAAAAVVAMAMPASGLADKTLVEALRKRSDGAALIYMHRTINTLAQANGALSQVRCCTPETQIYLCSSRSLTSYPSHFPPSSLSLCVLSYCLFLLLFSLSCSSRNLTGLPREK